MDNVNTLLSLPAQTLAVLTAGYLSYRLAYTGKDATHKTIDTLFLVFVFAFIAKLSGELVLTAASKKGFSSLSASTISILLGLVSALLVSAFWRRWGEHWTFKVLRQTQISHADRHQTAWETVISKSGTKTTLLTIAKKDGTTLLSEDLFQFERLPFGPCILGQDGSVALYVTHRKLQGSDSWDEESPQIYEDWGAEITIVPASEISEISLRAR